MGNNQSNGSIKSHRHGVIHRETEHNPKVVGVFNQISGSEAFISRDKFQERAGRKLGESLWKWAGEKEAMTLDKFGKCANILSAMSSDQLVAILMPPEHLIECCLEANAIPVQNGTDGEFIRSLVQQMTSNEETSIALVNKWMIENCPRLIEPVRNKIATIFFGRSPEKMKKIESEILSPAQMFILRQSLPTTIFWPKPASQASLSSGCQEDWILLYSSLKNGLSINRFQVNVFEYKGPTVVIFRLCSGEVDAIAADEEWRNSSNPFGGHNSALFKFCPKFRRIDSTPPAIYCNFKNRSSLMGIKYGRSEFATNADMSDVDQIEAWGCAGGDIQEEQAKMKTRHKLQAERNAKCPLPGNWNENPDKAILELGGIQFSNLRKDPDHN